MDLSRGGGHNPRLEKGEGADDASRHGTRRRVKLSIHRKGQTPIERSRRRHRHTRRDTTRRRQTEASFREWHDRVQLLLARIFHGVSFASRSEGHDDLLSVAGNFVRHICDLLVALCCGSGREMEERVSHTRIKGIMEPMTTKPIIQQHRKHEKPKGFLQRDRERMVYVKYCDMCDEPCHNEKVCPHRTPNCNTCGGSHRWRDCTANPAFIFKESCDKCNHFGHSNENCLAFPKCVCCERGHHVNTCTFYREHKGLITDAKLEICILCNSKGHSVAKCPDFVFCITCSEFGHSFCKGISRNKESTACSTQQTPKKRLRDSLLNSNDGKESVCAVAKKCNGQYSNDSSESAIKHVTTLVPSSNDSFTNSVHLPFSSPFQNRYESLSVRSEVMNPVRPGNMISNKQEQAMQDQFHRFLVDKLSSIASHVHT